MKAEKILTAIGIYLGQVAFLWGGLEAYTYFKGETLKDALGSFWILIYIIPILSTWYLLQSRGTTEMQPNTVNQSIQTGKSSRTDCLTQLF